MSQPRAALILEDGATFEGKPFGQVGEALGEAVFFTGVVGYQETLTDPSYRKTLLVLTYPIVGSYGVNPEDNESDAVQVSGVVIREYSRSYSNYRATGALEDFLKERGVVGAREVDTRAVAVHLRDAGEMRGAIVSGDFDPQAVAARLKAEPAFLERDLACETTWGGVRAPTGDEKRTVVALNFGVRESLLAQLAALGCRVEVLPCSAGADEVLAKDPAGVVLAGGPGDPRALRGAVETVGSLLGQTPLLGIGLGHQILALALGCRIGSLKTGHRGVNYPVTDLVRGESEITAQSHRFVVDPAGVSDAVEVTHVNLNDKTIEGIRCVASRAWSVQFHPFPDEMGRPSATLREFLDRT